MERRLVAVLIADVVGYSRLTQRDEEGTRARFNDVVASIVRPELDRYGGRLIKNMGDGLLIEFASVVNAMRTAIEIQKALAARNNAVPEAERISFRIGANLGDIIVEGDDIQGNGVNIAARLHGIFHRLVKQWRKQKADADLGNALLDAVPGRIDLDAQGAQHVGAAGLARNRAVAMFRDIDSGTGEHERRSR